MSILAVSILGLVPAELYYNIITPGTHSAVRKLKKKKKGGRLFMAEELTPREKFQCTGRLSKLFQTSSYHSP